MIIGVSGKIGAGKDTFAAYLQDLQPQKNWEVRKFAGKLKTVASMLTGVPVEKFEDPEFKKEYMPAEWDKVFDGYLGSQSRKRMTYREFLQKLGTDAMRVGLHTNVWVNALFADYKRVSSFDYGGNGELYDHPNWIITDVRFPNEAQAILDRGGKLVRINRFNDTGDHPSETALDDWQDWDAVIKNDGCIELFQERIEIVTDFLT